MNYIAIALFVIFARPQTASCPIVCELDICQPGQITELHPPRCGYETVEHETIKWHWEIGYGAWHDGDPSDKEGGIRTIKDARADCPGSYEPPGPDQWSYYQALQFFQTASMPFRCDRPHWPVAPPYNWRWIDTLHGAWRGARLERLIIDSVTRWTTIEPKVCPLFQTGMNVEEGWR